MSQSPPLPLQAESPQLRVKIKRLFHNDDINLKATADVIIGEAFIVHDLRICNSQNGLFVAMPQKPYKNKHGESKYWDTFHPITAEARQLLLDEVLAAYDEAIARQTERQEGLSFSGL